MLSSQRYFCSEPKREEMERLAARELNAFESATGLDQKATAASSSSSKSRKRKADDSATAGSQSSPVEIARIARQGQVP